MNEKIRDTRLSYNFSNNPQNYILDPETKNIYRKGKKLGGGGFGEVYEFIDNETNEIRAAKIISLKKLENPHSNEAYYNEYKFNNSLNYKYICKCYSTFKDSQNAYFILEYQPNKTLSDLINNRYSLTEIEVKHYCYELLLALEYLHNRNIIHRDIKLSNVLLSDKMEVKLCDFGLAIENRGENNKSICGTPNYIAPEILNHKSNFSYSFETDIWAFGIILYSLFFHKTPFEAPGKGKTKKNIQNIIYSFPSNNSVSENAKNLIRKILVKEPNDRPSIKEIKESKFFQNGKNIPKYLPPSTKNMKLSEDEMNDFINEAIINDECLDKEIIKNSEKNSNSPYFKYNNSFENYNENEESMQDSDKYNSTDNEKDEEKEKEQNKKKDKNNNIFRSSRKTAKLRELEKKIIIERDINSHKINYNGKFYDENDINKNNNNNNDSESSKKNKNNIDNNIIVKDNLISPIKEDLNNKEIGKLLNFNSFGKISDENLENGTKKANIHFSHPFQDTIDNNKTISKEKNTDTLLSEINNISKNTSINSNTFLSSKKLHYRNSSTDIFFHFKNNSKFKYKKQTINIMTINKNCDDIVVLKFIDLSSKCGIGYILSNGDIGAYFNDKTKLILIKSTLNIVYIDSKEKMYKIDFDDKNNMNKDIIKKLKVLSFFNRKFIKNKRNKNNINNQLYDKQTIDAYVIKWAKTRKASFFLLSNKEVQVIFNDNTQVIFNMKNLTVLYINHLKQKINEDMRLNTFSSFEMTIRVLYAKEVLTRL